MAVPSVTVIVLAYNHEPFIAEALDSVLRQRWLGRLEVLIAEDCSTDGTRSVADRYARAHPEVVRVLTDDENLGIARNVRRALDASSGDYVAFCEGDDYWLGVDKIEAQVELLERHPNSAFCFSATVLRDEASGAESLHPMHARLAPGLLSRSTRDLIMSNFIGNASSCMYRSSVVASLPPRLFATSVCDWIFNVACSEHGKIGFLSQPMSVYRRHRGGLWSGATAARQLAMVWEQLPEYDAALGYRHKAAFAELDRSLRASLEKIEGVPRVRR